ncbi:sugar transporter [Xylariomycetidae sp. FL2044]|nr:sugar transporter [Xylariomycetidae sp. FL2044]
MFGVLLTTVFNGCTMGYDQSMMSSVNALDQYDDIGIPEPSDFELDSNLLGLNVAIINAGSLVGGLFAGHFTDKFGRKWDVAMFCIGRFLLGAAITMNATAAPVWVMEMAHPKHKGWMGGVYMASWCLAATVASGISLKTYTIPNTWAWRALSIGQAVPSLLALTMVPFTPESPRWLMYHDRSDEALRVLKDVHGDGQETALVLAEFKQIYETIQSEKTQASPWKSLVSPAPNARRFVLVFLINIFAQIVGSNIVSSYVSILLEAVLTAVFGQASDSQSGKNATVAVVFLLLGTYSVAWTPLTYTYPVEVLKHSQRSKGVGLGHSICFCFGFLNQYTIPVAIRAIGWK